MSSADEEPSSEFDQLLDFLKGTRGFDFSGYKRPSLMRRVRRRMELVQVESFIDYVDYLEVHPEEFSSLFNTILINVTSFFRDQPSWEYLGNDILPRLLANKHKDEPFRVWCAGTASGEEAYTSAILLAEALGDEEFLRRVKIYATDLDDEALTQARQAAYSEKQIEGVPQELRAKYFEQGDGRYTFRKDLRRTVIFGRHDLIQDAPISRVDLLMCRNTLMYFNSEAQARILIGFHFALNDDGVLFLGKSELLLTHTNVFTPIDLKRRVFRKVPRLSLRDRLTIMADHGTDDVVGVFANHVRVREAAFETAGTGQIVIDTNGSLVLANQQARSMFGLQVKDIGRPLQDLEVSYRPVELRSQIERAYDDRTAVSLKEIAWQSAPGESLYFDLRVVPLISNGGGMLGVSITFEDVTRLKQLRDELLQSRQELETTYEELQSTVEELETTNEELQSANEELETLNEELQSTNEELETMNEELQSTNEELETINDEMQQRTSELNKSNGFLESVLTSLRMGVMVVDPNLRVQVWNTRAADLWGLRSDEVQGQHFLNLDIGLPVDRLKSSVRSCITGEKPFEELSLSATNRRGRAITCRVVCTALTGKSRDIEGAIVLMEERDHDGGS